MTSATPTNAISETSHLLAAQDSSIRDEQQANRSCRRLRVAIALPLVNMCFFLSYLASALELNPYLYDQISMEYPKVNMSAQKPCTSNMHNRSIHSRDERIQAEIERKVSTMELYLFLTAQIAAIIPVLILGPLSDVYGRKIGFICPVVGTCLRQIIYACTVWFKWPVNIFFLGNTLDAVGGSFPGIYMASFSFVSDVTKPGKQRAFFITVIEGITTLIIAGAELLYAQWIKTSYTYPLIGGSCFGLLALLMVIFVMPEPDITRRRHTDDRVREPQESNTCSNPLRTAGHLTKRCFRIYFCDDEKIAERRLCLVVFTLIIATDSVNGIQKLFLMKYPLCWPNSRVYIFDATNVAVSWVAICLLMPVFQKALNMKDRQIAIIGCVSGLGFTMSMGLATNDIMVYEAAAAGVLRRIIVPVLRSMMSSLVDSKEQGSMYASLSCMDIVASSIFSPVSNRVFYATLNHFAGAVYLVIGGLNLPAMVLLITLNVLYDRRTRDGNECPG